MLSSIDTGTGWLCFKQMPGAGINQVLACTRGVICGDRRARGMTVMSVWVGVDMGVCSGDRYGCVDCQMVSAKGLIFNFLVNN